MGSTIYTYQKSKRKPIPLTRDRLLTLKEHERALKKRVKTLQLHRHTIKVHIKSLLKTILKISVNETSR